MTTYSPPRPRLSIDPRIQFGRVCVEGTRITADTIGGMVAAGDSVEALMDSYNLTRDQVLVCCWWYADDCAGIRRKWEKRVADAWEAWAFEAALVLGGHRAGPLSDPPDVSSPLRRVR